jgi:hypothetical protein
MKDEQTKDLRRLLKVRAQLEEEERQFVDRIGYALALGLLTARLAQTERLRVSDAAVEDIAKHCVHVHETVDKLQQALVNLTDYLKEQGTHEDEAEEDEAEERWN